MDRLGYELHLFMLAFGRVVILAPCNVLSALVEAIRREARKTVEDVIDIAQRNEH